jgi:hypothetical protein
MCRKHSPAAGASSSSSSSIRSGEARRDGVLSSSLVCRLPGRVLKVVSWFVGGSFNSRSDGMLDCWACIITHTFLRGSDKKYWGLKDSPVAWHDTAAPSILEQPVGSMFGDLRL